MTYEPLLVRSKNAGPFTLTVDVMFDDPAQARRLYDELTTGTLTPPSGSVAGDGMRVYVDETAAAVKITMPRRVAAGSRGDLDLYGCQQHVGVLAALGLVESSAV